MTTIAQQLEAEFHKAIAPHVTKRKQGYVMGAFRAAIRAAVGGEGIPVAWWDGDDRVINLAAKEAGARSGGATASATSAYSIPLYASPTATVDVGALQELISEMQALADRNTGLGMPVFSSAYVVSRLAALIDGAANG